MSKSGIDELTESLKKVCAKHELLKGIPEKEIQRIIAEKVVALIGFSPAVSALKLWLSSGHQTK